LNNDYPPDHPISEAAYYYNKKYTPEIMDTIFHDDDLQYIAQHPTKDRVFPIQKAVYKLLKAMYETRT
jgi:hypothetical protein